MTERLAIADSWISLYSGSGTGTPLVLLTGFVGVASFWDPLVERIGNKRNVVRYDQRGTGDSGPFDTPLSVEQMADDAIRVINHLGQGPVHLVGHSAGACAGLIVAALKPSLVRSLTLIGGWTQADDWMRRVFQVRLNALDASGPKAYVELTSLFMLPASGAGSLDQRTREDEQRLLARLPPAEQLHARAEAVLSFDAYKWLPQVTCATLVIGANDDIMTPHRFSAQLAAAIEGARLESLADGGHYCPRTRPSVVLEALDRFISDQ